MLLSSIHDPLLAGRSKCHQTEIREMNSMDMPEVETATGTVRGIQQAGVRVFLGIPYAAPPVDTLRFAAPQPATPWSGVRDATQAADSSVQPAIEFDGTFPRLRAGAVSGREDCLYLNVYAPADPGPHPVLVWFHGGGGMWGSPQEVDGTRLARDGVVTVIAAYRLGALGLLYLPGVFDTDAEGNFALLDHLAALRWVRDNIAAFYGDPTRVTIGGVSNGGRGVGTLLATPSARGLFQQAVVQSGTGVGFLLAEPGQAIETTERVLAELSLDFSRAADLRKLPAEDIVTAQTTVAAAWPTRLPYLLVRDGTTVPRRPIDALHAGISADVRLLIGTTRNEQDAAMPLSINGNEGTSMLVIADMLDRTRSAYRDLLPTHYSEGEVTAAAITASEWWIPAIRVAEAHGSAGGATWMYRLDWRLQPRGAGPGALHGLDVPFALHNLDNPLYAPLLAMADGGQKRLQLLAEQMYPAWLRFIVGDDPVGAYWPRYDSDTRTTLIFDDVSYLAEDPDSELRSVWNGVLDPDSDENIHVGS